MATTVAPSRLLSPGEPRHAQAVPGGVEYHRVLASHQLPQRAPTPLVVVRAARLPSEDITAPRENHHAAHPPDHHPAGVDGRHSRRRARHHDRDTRLTTARASEITITPNDDGLPGIAQLKEIVGAIMSIGLILAVVAQICAGSGDVAASGVSDGPLGPFLSITVHTG